MRFKLSRGASLDVCYGRRWKHPCTTYIAAEIIPSSPTSPRMNSTSEGLIGRPAYRQVIENQETTEPLLPRSRRYPSGSRGADETVLVTEDNPAYAACASAADTRAIFGRKMGSANSAAE
jgi:hypothetical protein